MDVLSWRLSLTERDPTENMMRWMRSYDTPCRFACCYSTECAMIMCSHCKKSLTADGRMQTRYQCMECPVAAPDEPSRRPEFCEDCWHNPTVLHWHSNFCKVDAKGGHGAEVRRIGKVASATLEEADLAEYPRAAMEARKAATGQDVLCFICYCEFESEGEERPRGPPGCPEGHGEGIFHAERGLEDAGPAHAACWIQWYQSKDALTYCKSAVGGCFPIYCSLCEFEAEMAAWRESFDQGYNVIREAFKEGSSLKREEAASALLQAGSLPSCAVPDISMLGEEVTLEDCEDAFERALALLHPQPWIQRRAKDARESGSGSR